MVEQELTLEQKRLLSLLDYLEALEKLHRQPVFQISEHGGFAAYQKDILGLPSVELNELDETGQVWLSIEQAPPREAAAFAGRTHCMGFNQRRSGFSTQVPPRDQAKSQKRA